MLRIFEHEDERGGHVTMYHAGYLTTGDVGNGIQLDTGSAFRLAQALHEWVYDELNRRVDTRVKPPCSVTGCGRDRRVKGMCDMHYRRQRRGQTPGDLSRYEAHKTELLTQMVEEGCSLMEIQRTLGVDPRTVKKHFPDYKPVDRNSEKFRDLVRFGRQMAELERKR